MLVDTHCHLDAAEFDDDRDAVLGRAARAGVARIVLPAVEAAGFDQVRALAAQHGDLRYTLGIHPIFVDRAADGDLLLLRDAVAAAMGDPRFVGIGEIGLDHFVPGLDRTRQAHFLDAQLRIAAEFELPVLLHVRRAQDLVLKALRRFRLPGGIAHAFNGSVQQAAAFLSLGCVLGLGGAMTFERALQIRRIACEFPLDEAYVLETDAPDIPPSWIGRGRNEPAQLPGIAEAFAALRGTTTEQVIEATGARACRVLPRLDPGA